MNYNDKIDRWINEGYGAYRFRGTCPYRWWRPKARRWWQVGYDIGRLADVRDH